MGCQRLVGSPHGDRVAPRLRPGTALVDVKLRISDNLGLMVPETQDDIQARNAALQLAECGHG